MKKKTIIKAFGSVMFMSYIFLMLSYKDNLLDEFSTIISEVHHKKNYFGKSSYQFSEVPDHLESSCVAMFDIGFGNSLYRTTNVSRKKLSKELNYTDWNRLLNAKQQAFQSDEEYLPFVKSIPKLVSLSNGYLHIQNETRLQIMGGQLPYIPCPIKEYDESEVDRCWRVKNGKDTKIWLAFLGDSRARNMFSYVVARTKNIRTWRIQTKGNRNVNFDKMILRHLMEPINASSTEGDQLNFIAANYGTKNYNSSHPEEFLLHLLKLAVNGEKLPDLLIVSYGSWEFEMEHGKDTWNKYEVLLSHWLDLRNILESLSRYMIIIVNYQTRLRPTHTDHFHNRKPLLFGIFQDFEMKLGYSFSDNIMSSSIKNSQMIFWDSTLPFNLASLEECLELVKNNHSSLAEEEADRFMPFKQFMCHDRFHRTRSTLHDETTMLFNLLCNKLYPHKEKYCCS